MVHESNLRPGGRFVAARQTEEEIEKSRSQASRDLDENTKGNPPKKRKKEEEDFKE